MKRLLTSLLFLGLVLGCITDGPGDTPPRDVNPIRNGPLAMAITPKNFPSHMPADVDEAHVEALWSRLSQEWEAEEGIRVTAWRGVMRVIADRPVSEIQSWLERTATWRLF